MLTVPNIVSVDRTKAELQSMVEAGMTLKEIAQQKGLTDSKLRENMKFYRVETPAQYKKRMKARAEYLLFNPE